MIIKFSKKFDKSYQKLNIKIQDKFNEKLIIFENNKLDVTLNIHSLKWEYLWFSSMNVTWDYRAIYKQYSDWSYEFVEFVNIWTHSQLYK